MVPIANQTMRRPGLDHCKPWRLTCSPRHSSAVFRQKSQSGNSRKPPPLRVFICQSSSRVRSEKARDRRCPCRPSLGGQPIAIYSNRADQSGYLTDESGEMVPAIQAYWFAWYAFHPDTAVFTAETED